MNLPQPGPATHPHSRPPYRNSNAPQSPAPHLQRCKFTPVRPTSQLIPATYDITMNFDRTGGLFMDVAPR